MTAIASATLAGNRATDVRLNIPAWGCSYADVKLDKAVSLSGKVTLVLADLTVQMSVLSGGPASAAGPSYFRCVSGAGGWANPLPAKAYSNDAGVKLATVLQDAATAVGETFVLPPPTVTVGSYYTRPEGPACRVLEELAPSAWYVGEDGVTRLGARTPATLVTSAASTSELDLAQSTVTIASDTLAPLVPGISVDGLVALDVEHTFSSKDGVRSKIWGAQGSSVSRRLSALRALFDQLDPSRPFRGITEYRIVTQSGARLNLQPIQVSTGMPSLSRVVVRPGVPGVQAQYALGARALVGFVNADPGRPVVIGFEDAEGSGFLPQSLSILDGTSAIGRVGDSVQVTFTTADAALILAPPGSGGGPCSAAGSFTISGQITSGSPKVTSG
jgi:hypothetical protein